MGAFVTVAAGLAAQQERIVGACARAGRDPRDVQLLAVTKGHPASVIRDALQAGQLRFGESYAQELEQKHAELSGLPIEWHFVGRLQSNKARAVAQRVSVVHSVDRASLVDALARAAVPGLRVLVQVNSGGELSKGGCHADEAAELVDRLARTGVLVPAGLMTLPPPDDLAAARQYFRELARLRERIAAQLPPPGRAAFRELSMGMSDDLEVAVEEGATLVRVGTAIFGPRSTT